MALEYIVGLLALVVLAHALRGGRIRVRNSLRLPGAEWRSEIDSHSKD
jgi:hypothetical protein